jgi:hypothetical protein
VWQLLRVVYDLEHTFHFCFALGLPDLFGAIDRTALVVEHLTCRGQSDDGIDDTSYSQGYREPINRELAP